MGLYIHSLGELPAGATRAYYVYLLDYGWDQPLGDAVRQNLTKMADAASRSDAVVVHGPPVHFADEVLSWHHVNGQPAEELLPAILVTTRHPVTFQSDRDRYPEAHGDSLLLIPLRRVAQDAQGVADLIDKIFRDIREQRALREFDVVSKLQRGRNGALVDAFVLEPNVMGLGIDLKALGRLFKKRGPN